MIYCKEETFQLDSILSTSKLIKSIKKSENKKEILTLPNEFNYILNIKHVKKLNDVSQKIKDDLLNNKYKYISIWYHENYHLEFHFLDYCYFGNINMVHH